MLKFWRYPIDCLSLTLLISSTPAFAQSNTLHAKGFYARANPLIASFTVHGSSSLSTICGINVLVGPYRASTCNTDYIVIIKWKLHKK